MRRALFRRLRYRAGGCHQTRKGNSNCSTRWHCIVSPLAEHSPWLAKTNTLSMPMVIGMVREMLIYVCPVPGLESGAEGRTTNASVRKTCLSILGRLSPVTFFSQFDCASATVQKVTDCYCYCSFITFKLSHLRSQFSFSNEESQQGLKSSEKAINREISADRRKPIRDNFIPGAETVSGCSGSRWGRGRSRVWWTGMRRRGRGIGPWWTTRVEPDPAGGMESRGALRLRHYLPPGFQTGARNAGYGGKTENRQ